MQVMLNKQEECERLLAAGRVDPFAKAEVKFRIVQFVHTLSTHELTREFVNECMFAVG